MFLYGLYVGRCNGGFNGCLLASNVMSVTWDRLGWRETEEFPTGDEAVEPGLGGENLTKRYVYRPLLATIVLVAQSTRSTNNFLKSKMKNI